VFKAEKNEAKVFKYISVDQNVEENSSDSSENE
jgi:hypothetical protein